MTRSNSLTENKDFLSTLLSLFSEHTVDTGEKFWLCHFQTKRKKKTFFSLARVPTFVAALVTCTGCWGLLHRVGSGSVCCTILVKLIAGRWKEAAGEPKRHEGRTRL